MSAQPRASAFMPLARSSPRFMPVDVIQIRLARIEIPWGMICPHNAQAKLNHCGQDLWRLAARGGLSPDEALAILDDRPWCEMDEAEAYAQLKKRVDAWNQAENQQEIKP